MKKVETGALEADRKPVGASKEIDAGQIRISYLYQI